MSRKRIYIFLVIIFISGIIAGIFNYPNYYNQKIDYFNSKTSVLKLPRAPETSFRLGLDLQGGIHLIYETDLSSLEKEDYESALEGLRDVIERRVNLFGVTEPVVQIEGSKDHYRLIVELAGIKDPAQAIKEIGKTPFLEFKEQRGEEESQEILEKQKEIEGKTVEEVQEIENWQLAFQDPYFKSTPLTGKYLKKAEIQFDQTGMKPVVSIQFDDEGADIFRDLTSNNIGKPIAIYIDQIPISTPVVQEIISGGKAQITGDFSIEKAKELAQNLSAGALPVPISLISQQLIGPTLGTISLEKSLRAGIIGLMLIILFMIFFYRLPGFLASVSLIIYLTFTLFIFKFLPVTITLAGIGGFLLSIGMGVDDNILIFSRLKEELEKEKTFGTCVEQAFEKAWPSIRDGNFTTLIISLILFSFGASFIQGFALTLTIGILISMFSAIFITKVFLRFFVGTRLEKWRWLWG